ncbi:MAG TPA: SH3 domain-containing protein [Planctomycetota bacterium]|nr:SH3 domain-containing protein [Planctomycetota bacterium]
MFTLHAAFGPELPGFRGPFFLPAAAAVCLSVALAFAQEQAPAAKPQDAKPQAAIPQAAKPQAATSQDTAPAAAAPKLGRVVADAVALRCWPGSVAAPPVYEDALQKDQIVALGRSENGFRAVIVPLGPLGYVSRKYAVATAEGKVTTKGAKVAFRYRPRTTEAPVTQLADGTELFVVGEQEDWYRVRVPGVEAWVAEAEVQVGTDGDAELAAGYAAWKTRQQAEVQQRLDQIATAQKLEAQNKIDLAAVQIVQDAFAAELAKPTVEQKFDPLTEAIAKLEATLAPESAGKAAIESLKGRIKTQRWIAEATIVRDSKPAPVVDATTPEKKDPTERFQSIGWLRYERRLAGPGVYYLEKGGQRQYLVSCNTGRYDLALFVDREIGVQGPRRRPVTQTMTVLDIERLEVLGTARM